MISKVISKNFGTLLAVATLAGAATRPDMLVTTDWLASHRVTRATSRKPHVPILGTYASA